MIGPIVVVLVSVVCLTEAQSQAAPLPKFNSNVSSECNSYSPIKAGWNSTVGSSYPLWYSGDAYRCFQVLIQTVFRNGTLQGYFYRYAYFLPNDTGLTNRQYTEGSYVTENPSNPGQAQSFSFNYALYQYKLEGTRVVVGNVDNAGSSVGSAVVFCPVSGNKEVIVMPKGRPPSATVGDDLKAQLADNGLQTIPLNAIYQGSDCTYYWP